MPADEAQAPSGLARFSQGAVAALAAAGVALAHARRGRRIMTANIGLALAIIVALFPLALFGILGLAGVVLVHEIAEVVVILNGVRAARRPAALRQLATVPARQPEPAHA